MRTCFENFDYLIKAHAPIIWATSYEEYAFISDVCAYALENNYEVASWSSTNDYDTYNLMSKTVNETSKMDINTLINTLAEQQNPSSSVETRRIITIIKDAHILVENNQIKRLIRNLKEFPCSNYMPLVFLAPVTTIPNELEKLVTTFIYELPSREDVTSIVNAICGSLERNNQHYTNDVSRQFILPDEHEKNAIINSLLGLTVNEINFALAKSVVQHRALQLEAISASKINIIEKSGLLDYIVPKVNFDDIGGNEVFKQWISDIEYTFGNEAKDFGCEAPKGYMSLGIAGTGKTIIAEAIANKWGYPLFVFNVSKIFDKLVGQSEKKIEQALRIVKSCAPCVLLFDEAEKIFGGYSGSESDGGTSSRVFSSILRFMADNSDVFIVMTSNDISKLPPELTRSGRLDTTWYFTFPTADERRDIFKIHFKKTNHEVSDAVLDEAVRSTAKYTGAEIKNIVKQTIWETYKQYKETGDSTITVDHIKYAIDKVTPVYKTSKEKIMALENYAKQRALYANQKVNNNIDDSHINELLGLKM